MKFDVEVRIKMVVDAEDEKQAKELVKSSYQNLNVGIYGGKYRLETLKQHKILSFKKRV